MYARRLDVTFTDGATEDFDEDFAILASGVLRVKEHVTGETIYIAAHNWKTARVVDEHKRRAARE